MNPLVTCRRCPNQGQSRTSGPRSNRLPRWFLACLLTWNATFVSLSPSRADGDHGTENGPALGKSLHGDAFNEGPRQKAFLMPGMPRVHLGVTVRSSEAQKFFNQGVGQLHGFWFFEAERSFRQVASLDPSCAMAYWGMAMANANNTNRAVGFIRKAVDLKTNASPREILWIDAYHSYLKPAGEENERRKQLVKDLENISFLHPDELEAKTFLAFQIWDNDGKGLSTGSRQAVDALIGEVLNLEPLHPIHHARIHLWNYKKDERALGSAARCGQSAPGIAHMWHMPGHTFSSLLRYDDAAWQQEASARTDHAHMMAARILPDQIHNFAHNNEWLCRNLLFCGRVREAISLARNMVELPRHPKYNTLNRREDNTAYDKNNGSSMLGRNRLLDAFRDYELWDEMISLADTMYLEPTELPEQQALRLFSLAQAYFQMNQPEPARTAMKGLEECLKQLRQERFEAVEKAEDKARADKKSTEKPMLQALEGFTARLNTVRDYQDMLHVWSLWASNEVDAAREAFSKIDKWSKPQKIRMGLKLDLTNEVVKTSKELMKESTNQVPALALASYALWKMGATNDAQETFQLLRACSSRAELASPILRRLDPIASHLGLDADWRINGPAKTDLGERPDLETLGPFRWQPYDAPEWKLTDHTGRSRSLAENKGAPVLMFFYLGAGCVHCIEQLNALTPMISEFQSQGIRIFAVSTDTPEGLERSAKKASREGGFPFPLLSDSSHTAFKAYRAFDDFENMPLHGVFLIDGEGKVRWQDIGFEPFMDLRFLAQESRRLLGFGGQKLAGN